MLQMIDSPADWCRAVNGVLALACAIILMFGKGAPWRNPLSTLRMFSFSISILFLWQTYTSIEVIATTTGGDNGIRVYGFTGAYALVLLSLIIEIRRGKLLHRTHTLAEPVVVVTKQSQQ